MKLLHIFSVNVIIGLLIVLNSVFKYAPNIKITNNVKILLSITLVLLAFSSMRETFSDNLRFGEMYEDERDNQFSNYIKYNNNNCNSWNNLQPTEIKEKYDQSCIKEDDRELINKNPDYKLNYIFQNSSHMSEYVPNPDENVPEDVGNKFMFNLNKCSPRCCPSTYSSDCGCVCISDKQRNYINRRGGNA
jgi:hypothetical protein